MTSPWSYARLILPWCDVIVCSAIDSWCYSVSRRIMRLVQSYKWINTDMVTFRLKNTLKTTMRHCDLMLEETGDDTWNIRRKNTFVCLFVYKIINCNSNRCFGWVCFQGNSLCKSTKCHPHMATKKYEHRERRAQPPIKQQQHGWQPPQLLTAKMPMKLY